LLASNSPSEDPLPPAANPPRGSALQAQASAHWVKLKIYARCMSLLHNGHGHHIKVQLTSKPRTGQLEVIKNITLRL
jgi:hypothetical protein